MYYIYKIDIKSYPHIIHKNDIINYKETGGHLSIYGYDESLPRYFNDNNTLDRFSSSSPTAFSEVFYADFDDKKEEARGFYKFCKENNYNFKVFDSGNRSIHFHVYRTHTASAFLPYSDKVYASKNIKGCDTAIYRHGATLRMENTIHTKTDKKKVLLEHHLGTNKIDIPITEPELVIREIEQSKVGSIFNEFIIQSSIGGLVTGSRNRTMYQIIKVLKEYGKSKEFIVEFCNEVNKISNPPLNDFELQTLFNRNI